MQFHDFLSCILVSLVNIFSSGVNGKRKDKSTAVIKFHSKASSISLCSNVEHSMSTRSIKSCIIIMASFENFCPFPYEEKEYSLVKLPLTD